MLSFPLGAFPPHVVLRGNGLGILTRFPAVDVSKLRHKLYGCHVQDIIAKLIAQGGPTIMSMTQYIWV